MTKFVLDTEMVSSVSDSLNTYAETLNELSSTVSGFSVDCDIDFSPAINAIVSNLKSVAILTKLSSTTLDLVVQTHDMIQQQLRIQAELTKMGPSAVTSGGTYEIKSGDTLNEIAAAHGVSASAIAAINDIKNIDKINAGDKIVIPESSEETALEERSDVSEETVLEESNVSEGNSENVGVSGTNYKNNSSTGFNVTTDNNTYELSESDKELLMAIVASEADNASIDDCLAVASVILNRCEDQVWINSHGSDPISQATASGQFDGYEAGHYEKFMDGNVVDNVRIAVEDALNGVRNNDYLSFRSNGSTGFSDNMISENGNRYK